jgi:hypothetical protein
MEFVAFLRVAYVVMRCECFSQPLGLLYDFRTHGHLVILDCVYNDLAQEMAVSICNDANTGFLSKKRAFIEAFLARDEEWSPLKSKAKKFHKVGPADLVDMVRFCDSSTWFPP